MVLPTLAPLFVTQNAAAQPAAFERARQLSASPDAPTFGVSWRGALRGTLGAEVPVVRVDRVWSVSLRIVPLVELHNDPGSTSPLPNQSWRGRLAIEGWWSWRSVPLEVGLAVEHESDHATAREGVRDAFLELNDVALKSSWSLPLSVATLTFALEGRLFVFSCTRIETRCADFTGSTSFGTTASAVLDAGELRHTPLGWHPFVSVDASGIPGAAELVRERRTVLHAGMWSWAARTGTWAVFAIAFVGNDVGIGRAESVAQLGLGASWSP